MSVQLVTRPPAHKHSRAANTMLTIVVIAICAVFISGAGTVLPFSSGDATSTADAAVPPLTVAQGRVAIQIEFAPSRLRNCVRLRGRFIRCTGYNSWIAPGRWVYLGVFNDKLANLHYNWGELQ